MGSRYRRLRARLDNRQATVATVHAIARVVYRMLKYQVEYEQIKYMKKRPRSSAFNSCLPKRMRCDAKRRLDIKTPRIGLIACENLIGF